MKAAAAIKAPRMSARVAARIAADLDAFIATPSAANAEAEALRSQIEPGVLEQLDSVLALKKGLAYRDALLIQLVWGLEAEGFDHTRMGDGGRSASEKVGAALARRHIPAIRSAYQNIGKNQRNLARGNVPAFDGLLHWMNSAPAVDRKAVLRLLAAIVSLRARPVSSMPALRVGELSFARLAALLDDLLSTPSEGAHEQFAVAAFLEAVLNEVGQTSLWVKTKNIDASDASSGAAADIQVMKGNRIEEAFEVSANDWRGKAVQALGVAKTADLQRVNVLAYVDNLDGLTESLKGATADLTVMDVRNFLHLLTGVMPKPGREVALKRLYELLERNQPDIERVNRFVKLLGSHALTA